MPNLARLIGSVGVWAAVFGVLIRAPLPTSWADGTAKLAATQTQAGVSDGTEPPRQNIPAHVVYRLFLRHVATISERADNLDKQGKDGSHVRQGLIRKFSLDRERFSIVSRVAADLKRDLAENESRVQAMVEAFRSQYFSPEGELRPGLVGPPAPPAELKALGKERRELTIQAMARLRSALGDEAYFLLDQSVRSRFAPGIVRTYPGPSD